MTQVPHATDFGGANGITVGAGLIPVFSFIGRFSSFPEAF